MYLTSDTFCKCYNCIMTYNRTCEYFATKNTISMSSLHLPRLPHEQTNLQHSAVCERKRRQVQDLCTHSIHARDASAQAGGRRGPVDTALFNPFAIEGYFGISTLIDERRFVLTPASQLRVRSCIGSCIGSLCYNSVRGLCLPCLQIQARC